MSVTSLPERTSPQQRRFKRAKSEATAASSGSKWKNRLPLLPALVFVIVVTQIPWIVTLGISFLNWNALQPDEFGFAGIDNYIQVFTDPDMRGALLHTVVLVVSTVVLSMAIGVALALLVHRKFIGRGVVRTLLIAPFLIMPMAGALLWKYAILNPNYGLVDGALTGISHLFGGTSPIDTDWVTAFPMATIVTTLVWQWTPFMMLIVLAGLQSQPEDVLEAAQLDGAGWFGTFRFITFPLLLKYIQLGMLLGTIYIVQAFDPIYSITQGGPGTATTNLPYEIYLTVFRKYSYGEASAAGVIVVILSLIVARYALRTMRALFETETAR